MTIKPKRNDTTLSIYSREHRLVRSICDNVGKENLNKACIYTGKK